MRSILREFPVLLKLLSLITYCIILWGYIRHITISKKLKKYDETEIVSKETLDKLKAANILIIIGWITAIVLGIIGVLIYIE